MPYVREYALLERIGVWSTPQQVYLVVRFKHYEVAAINRVHHRVGHMTEVGRYRYTPAVRRDRRVAAALRGVMWRCKGFHIYTRRLRAVFAYLSRGELAVEYAYGVERLSVPADA